MSAFDRAEALDLDIAYRCGTEAVSLAVSGKSGVMVSIQRDTEGGFSLGTASS